MLLAKNSVRGSVRLIGVVPQMGMKRHMKTPKQHPCRSYHVNCHFKFILAGEAAWNASGAEDQLHVCFDKSQGQEITADCLWWTCGAELLKHLRSLATMSIMLKRERKKLTSVPKTARETHPYFFQEKIHCSQLYVIKHLN